MVSKKKVKTKPACEFCKNRKEFEMPQHLLSSLFKHELAIFAGAGVSTESPKVDRISFYHDIKIELKIPFKTEVSFPELMSLYQKQKGRRELLCKIKERFDYIETFPELYRTATEFHGELSRLFCLSNIVTTNWDNYFENEAKALSIVTPEDFALYNLPYRKVFKIHGSINNLGSIVATKEDYDKCYSKLKTGVIGASLKTMLATQTIVFIGYSLNDYDFLKIYNFLRSELKDTMPKSYIVTIDENLVPRYKKLGLTPIVTDGVYFIKKIKELLILKGCFIDPEKFRTLRNLFNEVQCIHQKICSLPTSKYPANAFCAYYQDGIIHAWERMMANLKTGEYYCINKMSSVIKSYETNVIKTLKKEKRHPDLAYTEGYVMGLKAILMNNVERKDFPYFYVINEKGSQKIKTFDHYIKLSTSKEASRYARKNIKKDLEYDLVMHHTPYLR